MPHPALRLGRRRPSDPPAARDGNGVAKWDAVWGTLDQLLSWRDLAAHPVGDVAVLPITDHRGSIVGAVESDASGTTLLAGADSTPMGRVATVDPSDDDAETCREEGNPGTRCPHPGGMPFGFAGAWRSEATGLVYMRFRWYSPTLAQFLTPDPMGEVDSWNLYAYVGGDPINRWEPWGLDASSWANRALDGEPMDRGGEPPPAEPKKPPPQQNAQQPGSGGTVGPWAERSLYFTTVAEKTKHSDEFLSTAAKAMATPVGLATGSWAGFAVYNIWNWAGRDAADDALKDAGLGDGGRFAVVFLAELGVGAAASMVGPKQPSMGGGAAAAPGPTIRPATQQPTGGNGSVLRDGAGATAAEVAASSGGPSGGSRVGQSAARQKLLDNAGASGKPYVCWRCVQT